MEILQKNLNLLVKWPVQGTDRPLGSRCFQDVALVHLHLQKKKVAILLWVRTSKMNYPRGVWRCKWLILIVWLQQSKQAISAHSPTCLQLQPREEALTCGEVASQNSICLIIKWISLERFVERATNRRQSRRRTHLPARQLYGIKKRKRVCIMRQITSPCRQVHL